jgi:imidazolonepropionase-like amidohydrolase
LIREGVIEDIRAAKTAAPPGYLRVDGHDAYVVPGLIDMHTHIYDRKDLVTSLAYGVTSVRNMRGLPMHLRWRQELRRADWLGATLFTSSPILDRPEHSHFMQQAVENPQQARDLVRKFSSAGYDLLKVYNDLEPSVLAAIVDEAANQNIPIAKHGPYDALPDNASNVSMKHLSTMQSAEHVEEIFQSVLKFEYDRDELQHYIDKLKQTSVFFTPTLATFDHLTQLSEGKQDFVDTLPINRFNPFFRALNEHYSIKRWLSASQAQIDWNNTELSYLLEITEALDQHGVPLLVGSDQGTMYMTAGVSTHREMALMQQAGISAATILKSATLNAAKAMHLEQTMGSIAPNKVADLVLVNRDPLEDINHLKQPIAVVKHGQWLDSTTLKLLIEAGEHPSHWYPSLGRLIEDVVTRYFN